MFCSFMEINSSSSSYGAATSDEHLMLQKTLFSATLKELKSLREQLYSAAEQFEESYNKEDHKPMVIETCKDYTIKALINTVDHLGSVAFKLNSYIDHTTCEVASMDLRVYTMDQRLKTWQQYLSQGGMYHNSLAFKPPNQYHKQYMIPGIYRYQVHNKFFCSAEEDGTAAHSRRSCSSLEIDFHHYHHSETHDVQRETSGSPSSFLREGYSQLAYPQAFSRRATLPFSWSSSSTSTNRSSTESPQQYQLLRSGSLLVKRSMSPNYANGGKQQNPLPPRRLLSRSEHSGGGGRRDENEHHSSRSKRLFKSLVSLRRSRKDGSIFKQLDHI
ncbi:Protein ABIL2 [Linum perenne]